jgi:hypothetical protein
MLQKLNRYLFVLLAVTWIVTYFVENNYRGVDKIAPEVLQEPLQTEARNEPEIRFVNQGYEYRLKPLFNYEINGLLVHQLNYKRFSIYSYAGVFQEDLCLIWGKNVSSKVFQSRNLTFSQDSRFAYYQWTGDINFNGNQLSNNHLIINSKDLERKLSSLNTGDQIRIKGKLVNVQAINADKTDRERPEEYRWVTSTVRTDSGAGACEIIYVEDIQVLQEGNPLAAEMHQGSLYGMIVLAVLTLALLFTGA